MTALPPQDKVHKGLCADTAISQELAHPVLALSGQAAQMEASSAASTQSGDQVNSRASALMLQAVETGCTFAAFGVSTGVGCYAGNQTGRDCLACISPF